MYINWLLLCECIYFVVDEVPDRTPLLIANSDQSAETKRAPCSDEVEPMQFARTESLFLKLDQLLIHYRTYNCTSSEVKHARAIILLHGFMGSVFSWDQSWSKLCDQLQQNFDNTKSCDLQPPSLLLAFDRPGFGLTTRPLPVNGVFSPCLVPPEHAQENRLSPLNPYSGQFSANLVIRVMDALSINTAILVGHRSNNNL